MSEGRWAILVPHFHGTAGKTLGAGTHRGGGILVQFESAGLSWVRLAPWVFGMS